LCTIIMLTTTSSVRRQPEVSYLTKPIIQSELLFAISCRKMKNPTMSLQDEHETRNDKVESHANILLAEDNLINQKLARRLLEKLGHRVTLVENGVQAVAAVEKSDYDLVLMDVQMPEMGGFEATAKIRQLEQKLRKHTPIIAMTAHALQGDRENCINAGMDDYMSKPINIKQLKLTLDKYIGEGKVVSFGSLLPREDKPVDLPSLIEVALLFFYVFVGIMFVVFFQNAVLIQKGSC